MNKKLLFGIMSLAALTACTNDDFESQKVAQEASPIQFEVLNNNDAFTRASMNGNKIAWSAADGDLFTLYHGCGLPNAGENAIYKATIGEDNAATLTTPTMIKQGDAIMVWPADTTFRIASGNPLTLKIKPYVDGDALENIEYNIPYVSDVIGILPYAPYSEAGPGIPTAYTTAGKDRKYQVFMRPMASQLTIKADYAGTDATLAALEAGEDGINPIRVTSVDLLTTPGGGTTDFTSEIALAFNGNVGANWGTVANNVWNQVTEFGAATQTADKLTTKVLTDNESCKFLILPQPAIAGGVADGAVVVNTIYGKVVVATPGTAATKYNALEAGDAWYRFISAASKAAGPGVGYDATETVAATAGADGKFKTTSAIKNGMMQTINGFSAYTATSGVAQGEPVGAAATRYVKVLLTHLDMSALHIESDKQLRDAAKVWKQMNLDDVTVYLDGGKEGDVPGEFTISQATIDKINEINASIAGGTKSFKVMPCKVPGEVCTTIVITGGGNIKDLTFIKDNGGTKAAVAFKAGENWKWAANNTVKVANTACGISKFINRGTFTSDATATINVKNDLAVPAWVNMPFENAEGATWNISGATLNVQFNVTNYGNVNIAKRAQYRQDGQAGATTFINEATAKPSRFGGNDAKIGKVENKGVFATVSAGTINNYGLVEHADNDAKTYITKNDNGGAGFGTAFGVGNKIGRINLPYGNKDEDNVSVSAALNAGFVSVTVDGEVSGALNASVVGSKVNYVIVKSGITSISNLPTPQIKYLEIDMTDKSEIAWSVTGTKTFDGLMVLSDINIKLGTTINVAVATYLGADMYVGGIFQYDNGGAWTRVDDGTNPAPAAFWNGYYGNTSGNVATKYITY